MRCDAMRSKCTAMQFYSQLLSSSGEQKTEKSTAVVVESGDSFPQLMFTTKRFHATSTRAMIVNRTIAETICRQGGCQKTIQWTFHILQKYRYSELRDRLHRPINTKQSICNFIFNTDKYSTTFIVNKVLELFCIQCFCITGYNDDTLKRQVIISFFSIGRQL